MAAFFNHTQHLLQGALDFALFRASAPRICELNVAAEVVSIRDRLDHLHEGENIARSNAGTGQIGHMRHRVCVVIS
jgi:hypothetical protein